MFAYSDTLSNRKIIFMQVPLDINIIPKNSLLMYSIYKQNISYLYDEYRRGIEYLLKTFFNNKYIYHHDMNRYKYTVKKLVLSIK
jgi:hypothetical protein